MKDNNQWIFIDYFRGHQLETWYYYLFQQYYRIHQHKTDFPPNSIYITFREEFEKFLSQYQSKIKTLKLRKKIISELIDSGEKPFDEFEKFKQKNFTNLM